MPIKLNSTGGGSVTLDVPSMSTANTLVLPAKSGNIITSADSGTITGTMIASGAVSQASLASNVTTTGPSFAVYNSTQISVPNTGWTKIALQAKEWDTANCFDNVTNFRFTPNVAGYYQFSGAVQLTGATTNLVASLYKNGNETRRGFYSASSSIYGCSTSGLIYLNGSTDYVELYAYNAGTSYNSQNGYAYTFLTGFLARAA